MKDKQIITWQRLEGLALFAMAVIIFQKYWGNWWVFVPGFFAPDLAALGYLFNTRVGAFCYNLTHALFLPALLVITVTLAAVTKDDFTSGLFLVAMIWFAHIGFDRAVGYGLKHGDDFKHTHLGTIGKK